MVEAYGEAWSSLEIKRREQQKTYVWKKKIDFALLDCPKLAQIMTCSSSTFSHNKKGNKHAVQVPHERDM